MALRHNYTLTLLNLADNNIDDVGGHALLDLLYCNHTLREIILSFNRISDGEGIGLGCLFIITWMVNNYVKFVLAEIVSEIQDAVLQNEIPHSVAMHAMAAPKSSFMDMKKSKEMSSEEIRQIQTELKLEVKAHSATKRVNICAGFF